MQHKTTKQAKPATPTSTTPPDTDDIWVRRLEFDTGTMGIVVHNGKLKTVDEMRNPPVTEVTPGEAARFLADMHRLEMRIGNAEVEQDDEAVLTWLGMIADGWNRVTHTTD